MSKTFLTTCLLAVLTVLPARAENAAAIEHLAALPDAPRPAVLAAALAAREALLARAEVARPHLMTIIDYTRPSTERRLWVIDLQAGKVLFHELVAHGRNSGGNLARAFSNTPDSLMTSLGAFLTGTTYVGTNGYSLRLLGLDPGLNDNAMTRAIVMHGADYVSAATAARLGRLGRSWGCPAVPSTVARPLIDRIKGGSIVYAYGPASAPASHASPR